MSDVAPPQPAPPQATAAATGLQVLVADAQQGLDRLPMLAVVADRLAAGLSSSIRVLLGTDTEVHFGQPRSLRLQEFPDRPGAPTAVLRMEPWGGRSLAVLDAAVAAITIERLLGGRRLQGAPSAGRSFTPIERAVVERLAREIVATNLATAFAQAGATGVTLERLEADASHAAVGKPAAPAILLHADVRQGNSIGGIDFLIPNATLEPMRSRLSQGQDTSRGETDEAWHAHLTAELPLTHVRLRAVIEQRRVQAADLLRWQVGSKLTLSRRHDEPIDIFCRGLLVLRGRIAEKDGRIALHIEERRLADDGAFAPPPTASPDASSHQPAQAMPEPAIA